MNQNQLDTDLIIAGGGLAGATLALAMARVVPELRVTVVETVPLAPDALPEDYQPSYDARSTALAWGSRLIFEELGLWSAVSEHATPIRHIHVSDRGHFGATRLHAQDHGQEALGYVVDNRWMGLCLMRALLDTGVEWQAPAEVTGMTPTEQGVCVNVLKDGEPLTLTGQCLVVADGGRSGLREKLGFQARTEDYGQNALIANVSTGESHQFVAYERFTDTGPMALLPHGSPKQPGNQSALVWTLSDTALHDILSLSDEQKCRKLQERFGWRLGAFTRIGECYHYPLKLSTVDEAVRPGVALVGNAAHALHPVAGQGFNLALRGLVTLVEQFRQGVDRGVAIGNLSVLGEYQRLHRQDWRQTVQFSDSLIRLFGQPLAPVTLARDAGLMGLDLVPGAKRWFARKAMGTGGRRPVLPLSANVGEARSK
ncbi:2-octaprenyl-6-methoxyphenyl hydroxylase [Marinobacter persicus]|uniref:2-octaprenyl-6-methoxyphenol hydroxylase n=1 Tax=Marinobacter persicus TaxID=930118 RepID=A0A2S6GAU8_9GAMM|nr:2-octaprenyl-6-methoxyphenyl hydroxylase [Marinobacter persicus]PPK53641.1 2-octaprenyl-6-methoxyphenol hydroxylase [Marinobacter persicus]PPK56455.1 2-octaprenyl-6-methoxyphenol hydroxylase [Marinobacter persicus]PPK60028.1 2-octaprenyl-6-methoxyphenol hydroxylase [Marinobacter persicus]